MSKNNSENPESSEKAAVLVVGGSLVGLSSAMFLAWHGVPTILIERHPGSSPHPRAIGFTPMTMEAYLAPGLTAQIPQAPPTARLRRARVSSLAGEWFEEIDWTPAKQAPTNDRANAPQKAAAPLTYSPYSGAAIAQDRLEPMIRAQATTLGADVRFKTELLRFTQDDSGVSAFVREREGREYTIRAKYVIAADGQASPIREALGIARSGRGHMRTVRSVLFRAHAEESGAAPLETYLEKGIMQFEIDQPDFKAFVSTYHDGRWFLMFSDDEERDAPTLMRLVNKAIGRSDLRIEIITTGRWELSALIADTFRSGRVFLAGDAAHTLPPSRGGFGANTGIADAHNLAWKLAAVLSGASTPSLLDTYDAERRPIAWLRHDQIFTRPDYKREAGAAAREVIILDDDAMELGQIYRSTAVIGAGPDLPPALRPELWAGQPGTRAPHVSIAEDGKPRSTLDLFGRDWVLLAGDDAWRAAAAKTEAHLGVAVRVLRIGVDVRPTDPAAIHAAFGLGEGGASLVRPDGYIAWRAPELPTDPAAQLVDALSQVSSSPAAPIAGR